METLQQKSTMTSKIIWLLVAIVGAVSFGILALSRGEHVNAVWLVLAAACVYSIAYRFYSLFIANKVFELNTPFNTRIVWVMVWIMCRPIKACYSVTILPRLPVRVL